VGREKLMPKFNVFFAIPCGTFYLAQAEIIKEVADSFSIVATIAEDDPSTKGLWDKIKEQIDSSDVFIADVSSGSPNILFELGYAIGRKPVSRIGLFCSEATNVPSDLHWLVRQLYGSLEDFRKRLGEWLSNCIPGTLHTALKPKENAGFLFAEDFMNQDYLLRRWTFPPRGSYQLTSQGLRFTDAHFPILTNCLSILRDCQFEFMCRIEDRQVGWVVKGTQDYWDLIPTFCLMFTLRKEGLLTPLIWNRNMPHPHTQYHVFEKEAKRVKVELTKDEWFSVTTRVKGDRVEICLSGGDKVDFDFTKEPFRDFYANVPKHGQVGFRCYPSEVAIVGKVRVKELYKTQDL
jgi:hypothetical protein